MAQGKFSDLTGLRFGRFVVKGRGCRDKQGKPLWICLCDCGETREHRSSALSGGDSLSCGCLAREMASSRTVTHGMTGTVEYDTWRRAKQRCFDTNSVHYPGYGGRGITMCERWASSFENFLADMGPRPSSGHSIDRIDNSRDYEPGNCRWATITEQNRNKSSNVVITAFGRTQLAADWARETGLSKTTIGDRMRRGLSGEQLVAPAKRKASHV